MFVTPLTGIVCWSSLLSVEGFEPVTLVSPSPPIYTDPSWPLFLSFSLSSPSLPLPFLLFSLAFFSQGHCFSICGLPWTNICFKMPVTARLSHPSDNLALPWQFSSSLSPWVHILLPIPLNFRQKFSEARTIFLFEKCWKCFWCGSPPIRNSRLGSVSALKRPWCMCQTEQPLFSII